MRIRQLLAIAVLTLVFGFLWVLPGVAREEEAAPPARGMFLVADREMSDPRFTESVILLLSADQTGAMGLIINKPTGSRLSEILPESWNAVRQNDRLYYGGPVGSYQLLLLLRSASAVKDAVRITQEVMVSSDRDVLRDAVLHRKAGEEYRVFAGYAGWAAGQLELELKIGQWRVISADVEMVFHKDASKVWPALIRKSEEIMVREKGNVSTVFRAAALQRP